MKTMTETYLATLQRQIDKARAEGEWGLLERLKLRYEGANSQAMSEHKERVADQDTVLQMGRSMALGELWVQLEGWRETVLKQVDGVAAFDHDDQIATAKLTERAGMLSGIMRMIQAKQKER